MDGRGDPVTEATTGNADPVTENCVLALRGVRKVYGATVAVESLTLRLAPSSVHAVGAYRAQGFNAFCTSICWQSR